MTRRDILDALTDFEVWALLFSIAVTIASAAAIFYGLLRAAYL